MKLLYLANIRMPTEKAHGLQIMQNCEAFAHAGAAVRLIVARRINTPEMAAISDPWAYYGVARNFTIQYRACIDLFFLGERFSKVAFFIQSLSYTLWLIFTLLLRDADVYYSRDLPTLLLLSLFKSRRKLCYEAHQVAHSGMGRTVQQLCVKRVGTVIAVTDNLAQELEQIAGSSTRFLTAHDGYRHDRFDDVPDQQAARLTLKLPEEAFIVGYTGRLHTMSMSKGIDKLIEAIAALPSREISLCLVGGPDETAAELREHWLRLKLPANRFLYVGHVSPSLIPMYLSAFDVCAMPFPDTEHFRLYASPLKLFEYMAAGRAILATNLPATAEVVRHDETALLVPPDDVPALTAALRQLYDNPDLRERLGWSAQRDAGDYSWQSRAGRILGALEETL